jgi:outer membrane usher protein
MALAQPGVLPQAQPTTVPEAAVQPAAPQATPPRLNPTGKAIALTVPVKDGAIYLGDINLSIGVDDALSFSSQRMFDLLSNIIDPKILETLRASVGGRTVISPQDLAGSGVRIIYDPQTLDLNLVIPSQMRAARAIQVSAFNQARFGAFQRPAGFSAYMNIRGAANYNWQGGSSWGNPSFDFQGAARAGPIELESEQIWQPGVNGPSSFQRVGTRFVYDDMKDVVRWSVGDLLVASRGFQAQPDMAGISVFRSYSVLQPQTIARPTGASSFTLSRQSTVEIYINGQMVRRVLLNPGTFNLRDFPFTQGANDVRLSILDDAGRTQILRFNLFLDQAQLATGLSEFGFYAGVKAPLGPNGPVYTDHWQVSGFYRRGINDSLTLGGNFQADQWVQMGGVEAIAGTPIGVFAANVAGSEIRGFGAGYAATFTYQRLIPRRDGQSDSLNLAFQTFSKNFGPVGTIIPNNPFEYEVSGGYSHAFNDYLYSGVDVHYSKGRDNQPDDQTYRGTVGWRLTPNINVTTDLLYESNATRHDVAGLISLTMRLGPFSSVRADYDTRDNDARLTFQTLHGSGVGSYNITGDVERTDQGSGVNATANYIANRAEFGFTHASVFDGTFGSSTSQVTSARIGTSVAFADGAFSVGRPIYDAFAIVVPYKTLGGAPVVVDPTPYGYQATTGILGSAIEPNLASYNERTVTVNAPTAPPGIDLGAGAYRLLPPYHGGYRLQVGSEYYVTVIGRLVNEDGSPVSLVSGKAIELSHTDHEPVVVFTNHDGRFGLAGLKPGRWRIEMLTEPKTAFVVEIPANANAVVRVGDLKPMSGQ